MRLLKIFPNKQKKSKFDSSKINFAKKYKVAQSNRFKLEFNTL